MNPITVTKIVSIFKRPGERGQIAMIASLVQLGHAGRDFLIAIWYSHTTIDVRRWAVHGLGNYTDIDTKRIIRKALTDPAMSVRLHAIRAIDAMGDKKMAAYIKPLLRDVSGGIRNNALDVLVKFGVKGMSTIAKGCLLDEKKYIRDRARYYLDSGAA